MEKIVVLDFGSQYNQLIARRIRELGVYSEIFPYNISLNQLQSLKPKGIILSGGPASVYEKDAPVVNMKIFDLGIPVLGICYGLQIVAKGLGCKVVRGEKGEYGHTKIKVLKRDVLFKSVPDNFVVWMSHRDCIFEVGSEFVLLASSSNVKYAAVKHTRLPFYGLQFHPEVSHTQYGSQILKNFLYKICKCKGGWRLKNFVKDTISQLRKRISPPSKVIIGVSGGVDSTVVAQLLNKAVGKRAVPIFINNGLMRKNEPEQIVNLYKNILKMNLIYVDASKEFLKSLRGVRDPEKKRKIIGHKFIEVFCRESKKIENVKYLAQGTLYPDVIESISAKGGPSSTIKSHHNVGGLPEKIGLELVEPIKELFKDEVRVIGSHIGLPREILIRHPFPGPGLGVRIIGAVSERKIKILQEADYIIRQEIEKANLYEKVWQAFGVLLPVKSVGVMGDSRTYEYCLVVRIVESTDGMTADWVKVPYSVLNRISNRIINEVSNINRVVYDISSKPPATIEWE